MKRSRHSPTPDVTAAELTSLLTAALEDELSDAISTGRVVVEPEPNPGQVYALLRVVPTNANAAPLTVQVDDEHQLTLYPGRSGTWPEFWSRKPEELVRWTREVAAACRDGTYEETVRAVGESIQGEARWPTPDGMHRARFNTFFTRVRPGRRGFRLVTYEPY